MALLETIIGFILAGIAIEVLYTSIIDYIETKDPRLKGETYLWMFLVYALVPFVFMFGLYIAPNTNVFIRSVIYMFGGYTLELTLGYSIRKLVGVSPWNYSNHKIKIFNKKFKSHISGLICLEYAPILYACGIAGEYYFKFLIGL